MPKKKKETMEDLLDDTIIFPVLQRGDVVKGTVLQITDSEALIDLGTKSEGILPKNEFKSADLKQGDDVFVYVLTPESKRGQIVLSISRAEAAKSWIDLKQYLESGETFEVVVTGHNKGGLMVDVLALQGFLPFSHLENGPDSRLPRAELQSYLDRMRGEPITVKLLELNEEDDRIIVSERLAVEELETKQREKALSEIKVGDVFEATIKGIMPYGLLVSFMNIEGLVAESDISWDQSVSLVSFAEGDTVNVKVTEMHPETADVTLSIKDAEENPWENIEDQVKVGDVVSGQVKKITSFGVFIEVLGTIEGLLSLSQLPEEKRNVKVGDTLEVIVKKIDKVKHVIDLDLKNG